MPKTCFKNLILRDQIFFKTCKEKILKKTAFHKETGVESIWVTSVTNRLHGSHCTNFLWKSIILMEMFHMKYSNLGITNVVT